MNYFLRRDLRGQVNYHMALVDKNLSIQMASTRSVIIPCVHMLRNAVRPRKSGLWAEVDRFCETACWER